MPTASSEASAEAGAADRPAAERRILLLTHRIPYPPDKGDRIRSYHLLEHLARLGTVDLATLVHEEVSDAARAALGRLCRRVLTAPVRRWGKWVSAARSLATGRSATEGLFASRRFRAGLDAWLGDTVYDAIVCFSSGTLPYVLGRGLESRLVVDLVDVDSQKWLDYADVARPPLCWLLRLEGNRVRRLERAAAEARAVVLVSGREADLYRAFCPTAAVEVNPNGVDLDYFHPAAAAEEPALVFVGQLDYRANVISLEWFCREVWPQVQARLPGAVFRVVGRNPVPAVRRLERVPGVQVVGEVPDVRPWLLSARLVVVPLLVARGIQNKVLEALAMGRPVVASPQAVQGLSARPGTDLVCAETADEWLHCLIGLWDDEERRQQLGRQGRAYVEASHRWAVQMQQFAELLPPGRAAAAGRPG